MMSTAPVAPSVFIEVSGDEHMGTSKNLGPR